MKKILAVSGGIDSVVMLHYFHDDSQAVVAHFNHGIRANSQDDQRFVEWLASNYGLEFVTKDAELGMSASEADARAARYAFLSSVCEEYGGRLYVAHHRDDVLESIAINLLRGTGWRGLAPFRNASVERPLLEWTKNDIYHYAAEHKLSFRQDQTNTEDIYLRNRVRSALAGLPEDDKRRLFRLYQHQCKIADKIKQLVDGILADSENYIDRDVFRRLDSQVSLELLRELLLRQGISQTRPQMLRILDAIKNYQPGKKYPLNRSDFIQIYKYHFSIKKLGV